MEETNTVELDGTEIDAKKLEEAYENLDGDTKYGLGVSDDGSVAVVGDGFDDNDVSIIVTGEPQSFTTIESIEEVLESSMDFDEYLFEEVGLATVNTYEEREDKWAVSHPCGLTSDETRDIIEDDGVKFYRPVGNVEDVPTVLLEDVR